jgi:hypothetical protein
MSLLSLIIGNNAFNFFPSQEEDEKCHLFALAIGKMFLFLQNLPNISFQFSSKEIDTEIAFDMMGF